jgi:hypothetical protein
MRGYFPSAKIPVRISGHLFILGRVSSYAPLPSDHCLHAKESRREKLGTGVCAAALGQQSAFHSPRRSAYDLASKVRLRIGGLPIAFPARYMSGTDCRQRPKGRGRFRSSVLFGNPPKADASLISRKLVAGRVSQKRKGRRCAPRVREGTR